MDNSFLQLVELSESSYDFALDDLLRALYHIYNINATHPFIALLQSFCFKFTQEGLTRQDNEEIRKIIKTFLLFPKSAA